MHLLTTTTSLSRSDPVLTEPELLERLAGRLRSIPGVEHVRIRLDGPEIFVGTFISHAAAAEPIRRLIRDELDALSAPIP